MGRSQTFSPAFARRSTPPAAAGDGQHDLPTTAATIGPAGTGAGVMGEAGDLDYWRVTIPSHGMLIAQTTGDIDTIGALEDEQGRTLATNDDGGTGLNFRIERDVEAGTYFVRVAAAEESLGDYVLHVDHAPSSIDALPELPLQATSTEHAIGAPGEVDRFRVEVATDGFIALRTSGKHRHGRHIGKLVGGGA